MHKQKETFIVSSPNASAYPRTMMIHDFDTAIANSTMNSPWRSVYQAYFKSKRIILTCLTKFEIDKRILRPLKATNYKIISEFRFAYHYTFSFRLSWYVTWI